jgi:hypothetical protein
MYSPGMYAHLVYDSHNKIKFSLSSINQLALSIQTKKYESKFYKSLIRS